MRKCFLIAILLFNIGILVSCGNNTRESNLKPTENQQEDEVVMDTEVEKDTEAKKDIETEQDHLIRSIQLELTQDATPEQISMQMVYIAGENTYKEYDEASVDCGEYGVMVTIKDGATEEILYERLFYKDHMSEGQLALVTDGDRWYIFENVCLEQMGTANYRGEVFYWSNGEKEIVDSFTADFLLDHASVLRSAILKENIICRDDVIEEYRGNIEKWYKDSELLVACDTIGFSYNEKEVYVSTKPNQYHLDDFFAPIWKRNSPRYETKVFENVMGEDGIVINDISNLYVVISYYYSYEGEIAGRNLGRRLYCRYK